MSTASAGEIIPEWEDLLRRSRCNRVFGAPVWFLAACHAEPELSPLLVTVRRDGALAALAPLVRDANGTVRFASHLSDYNDVIAADDIDAVALALDHVRASGPLSLLRMRADSNAYRALTSLGLVHALQPDREMSFVDLRCGYDAYVATRSRNFRWNARDALRKSAAAGCRVVELTPETFSPDALVETFFELHFQRVPDSVLRRPLYMTVMREATPQLFRERKMRAFAVMQEERVIALDLCTTGNDSLGLWNGGFDNAFGAISPGRVLMHHCARLIADEGIGEYDLLRGDQDYKRKWRTEVRGTWQYTNH